MNSHRRSRTADSRNSTLTGTASSSSNSIGRFSSRSTTTLATSIDDEPTSASMSKGSRNSRTRSLSRGARKLVKRAKSPFTSDRDQDSDSDDAGPSTSYSKESLKRGRSASHGAAVAGDASERDLAMRLELARRNSQNQNGHDYPSPAMQEPGEDTIYEGTIYGADCYRFLHLWRKL